MVHPPEAVELTVPLDFQPIYILVVFTDKNQKLRLLLVLAALFLLVVGPSCFLALLLEPLQLDGLASLAAQFVC